jgi:DNA adenine methylase
MPVVKWVGGKRQLLDSLVPLMPKRIRMYCEPFIGGGAMFLHKQPVRAYVNDINAELINLYETIRDYPDELLLSLEQHKNEKEYFLEIREWDKDKEAYAKRSGIEKASRMIYLNKTCFNGLYRVNRNGEFNVPFGKYSNPNIVNAKVIKAVSRYLNRADIQFFHTDYETILDMLPKNSFVYLDPPYDPVSQTANFTGYTKKGFNREEQIRLRENCDELHRRGIKFMLSNSATDFIKEQYGKYDIMIVKAKRAVNADTNGRGVVEEVVVRNYRVKGE